MGNTMTVKIHDSRLPCRSNSLELCECAITLGNNGYLFAGSGELSLVPPNVDGYRRFQKPQKPLT